MLIEGQIAQFTNKRASKVQKFYRAFSSNFGFPGENYPQFGYAVDITASLGNPGTPENGLQMLQYVFGEIKCRNLTGFNGT